MSEVPPYLGLIDSCITQRKAQGPARTCNESKEEEEAIGATGALSKIVGDPRTTPVCGGLPCASLSHPVQGYLTHKKQPPPLGPP